MTRTAQHTPLSRAPREERRSRTSPLARGTRRVGVGLAVFAAGAGLGAFVAHQFASSSEAAEATADAVVQDSGDVNPWAAGSAAAERYFAELGRDCMRAGVDLPDTSHAAPEAPSTG
jgi:acetylornithine deacetylase/succinyl-diaminopimelate desuccinylase-like protein